MLRKTLLITVTILGFYFCYDLGYLLTGEFGIGQLYGVPFAIILAILSMITFCVGKKLKARYSIITVGYLLTMLTYTLTILGIKHIRPTEYQYYLYHYADGKSPTILAWILLIGSLLTFVTVLRLNKDGESDGS